VVVAAATAAAAAIGADPSRAHGATRARNSTRNAGFKCRRFSLRALGRAFAVEFGGRHSPQGGNMISRPFIPTLGVLLAAAVALAPSSAVAARGSASSELQDRAAIQNLVVKYTIALDTLDADLYASVFAEDAEFTFGGKTYKGRAEIRKIVSDLKERRAAARTADAPKSYHALSNTYIELVNDHEARHRSYWQTITGPSSGPFTVGGMGRYEDTLVKRNGEWLIQKREIIQ
jgi:uncharacterized protein (TIGR02246 family)